MNILSPRYRCRVMREQQGLRPDSYVLGLSPESQCQNNLVLAVWCVPSSLDSGANRSCVQSSLDSVATRHCCAVEVAPLSSGCVHLVFHTHTIRSNTVICAEFARQRSNSVVRHGEYVLRVLMGYMGTSLIRNNPALRTTIGFQAWVYCRVLERDVCLPAKHPCTLRSQQPS